MLYCFVGKTSSYNATKFPSFFRRQHDRSEEFIKADSALSEFENVDMVSDLRSQLWKRSEETFSPVYNYTCNIIF